MADQDETPVREYKNPSLATVVGALSQGVDDPELMVDERWTDEQKRRYKVQFNTYLRDIRDKAKEQRDSRIERGASAMLMRQEQIPFVSDVAAGVRQGAGDLGSLALRALDRPTNQESLADTANRELRKDEELRSAADRGSVAPWLKQGIRGAARSVTQAAVLAATGGGEALVIGGFAASRGNQAITEAKDANLKPEDAARYVGRAALIEGGVAGAFSALGGGAFEKVISSPSGLRHATMRQILKNTGLELTEENITEVLDNVNQAVSKVSGPVTPRQTLETIRQTTVQTLLTMGFTYGAKAGETELARRDVARSVAENFGLPTDKALEVVRRAAGRQGNFEANLGRELLDQYRMSATGLAEWATSSPEAMATARALAQNPSPSRAQWSEAGLPRVSKEERAEAIKNIQAVVNIVDAPPDVPVQPPAATQAPPAPPPPVAPPPAPALPPQQRRPGQAVRISPPRVQPPAPPAPAQIPPFPEAKAPPLPAAPPQATPPAPPPAPEGLQIKVTPRGPVPTTQGGRASVAPVNELLAEDLRRRVAERMAAMESGSKPEGAKPAEELRDLVDQAKQEQEAAKVEEAKPAEELRDLVDQAKQEQDWRTADVETLRGMVKRFEVPSDEHAAAEDRLAKLENPFPEGQDWRKADRDVLANMLAEKAIPATDLKAAEERLVELHQQPQEQAAEPPKGPDREAMRSGEKANAVIFASGLTRSPAELDEAVKERRPVGVAAFAKKGRKEYALSAGMVRKLVDYANSGGKVFVDSGAFSNFKAGEPADWTRVTSEYGRVFAAVKPENRRNVFIVAPDTVGNQTETQDLQRAMYKTLNEWEDLGVSLIVPVQKGEEDLAAAWALQTDALKNADEAVIGVPFNAKAWTQGEVLDYLRNRNELATSDSPELVRMHLLGGGKKKVEALIDAARDAGLDNLRLEISGDSLYKAASERRRGDGAGEDAEPETPTPEAVTPATVGPAVVPEVTTAPVESPPVEEAPPAKAEPAKDGPKSKDDLFYAKNALMEHLRGYLARRQKFDWRKFHDMAVEFFGDPLSAHTWEMQDAYEALEWALNKHGKSVQDRDLAQIKADVADLQAMLDVTPTQTRRSEQKDDFQQFSTPITYAYVADWVANPRGGDVVLEPSAGTGTLLAGIFPRGLTRIANEIDVERGKIARSHADKVFNEDAEQIDNILGPKLKDTPPTLVVMNPPFSRAGQRMQGKKLPMTGANHVEAALNLLAPGGRLVAIVGRGMTMDAPTFVEWWSKIGKHYRVRANVGVSGDIYHKQGTDFATRLLVIDKVKPDGAEIVGGDVESLEALIDKLKEVRDDRPAVTPRVEEGRGGPAEAGPDEAGGVAPGGAAVADAAAVERPAADAGAVPAEGVRGEQPAGDVGRGGGRVPRGGRRGAGGRGARGVPAGEAARADAGDGAGVQQQPVASLEVKAADKVASDEEGTYEGYQPAMSIPGAKPHGAPLVESAAMASVTPQRVNYQPKIPQELINSGALSDAQINAIIYAGYSHQQVMAMAKGEQDEFKTLTGKDAPPEKRRGFFVGDGTGVGKGRTLAGVILDNWNQGRRRAIWVTEKPSLINDAVRDWTDLGGSKNDIRDLGASKAGQPLQGGDGIMFTTYSTLGTSVAASKKEDKQLTRVEQIADWFGPGFDGVIVLDESHNAGNAVEMKGGRGKTKPAAKALMVVELQRRLPNARVVYASATGATQVANLAYADRLGLWGEGTEFATREAFINGISAGGVAAMELVARDMKAQSMYVARSLSFKGVGYNRLTHALTPEQREIYDSLADAWQVVLQNIHEALALTAAKGEADPKQKANAMSAFWGAHQRFFQQILTSLQMPSVLKALDDDVKAGRSPVIQLVNTLEASTERGLAKLNEEQGDLDDLDLTPRDALMNMVEKSFPVSEMEEYLDANGNVRTRPVTDSAGNVVKNAQAVALKERLLERLGMLRVPDSPIDQIVNYFGPGQVAEVTGRKRRVVNGEKGREIQSRSKAVSKEEVREFLADERKVLIFSEAGGTGSSYHADMRVKNQRLRRHYVLQAGWRADKAIQGLGRSHRTNQRQAPEFVLVETDLPGHKRFISTIAKRLEQLGALSRGQRTASGGGLFSERDNLEGPYAQDALTHLLTDIVNGDAEGIAVDDFEKQTGLTLRSNEGAADVKHIRVSQFLNRMLSLKIPFQNLVFDAYSQRLDAALDYARSNGTLDVGMETIKAKKVEKVTEKTIRVDPRTGAETKYVKLKVFNPPERLDFSTWADRPEALFRKNLKSGRHYVVLPSGTRTDEKGRVVDVFSRVGPTGKQIIDNASYYENHVVADRGEVEAEWNQILRTLPSLTEEPMHMITGALLPVWNRIKSKPRIRRAITESGEKILGRVVSENDIDAVLADLGVENKDEAPSAQAAQDLIMSGGSISFVNGWVIRRVRVATEQAIELTGQISFGDSDLLAGMGVRRERIAFRTRFFLPTGEGFAPLYERLVKNYEVRRVTHGSDDKALFAPDDGPTTAPSSNALTVGPGGKTTVARAPQQVEVISLIERLWPGLSVRGPGTFKRKFKTARALGWYRESLGEMRLRDAYDVTTALHELGHHFDRELGKWSRQRGMLPSGVEAELMQLGRDLYGNRKPEGGYKAEGFAEFVREYLTRQTSLRGRAPNLYQWWTTEYLPENAAEADKIKRLGDAVELMMTATPTQTIEAFMRPTEKDWSAERIAADARSLVDYKMRDAGLALLHGMQATGADLSRIAPSQHPYMLLTFYARSAGGRTRHAALSNTVSLHGIPNGASLREVLAPVIDQGEEAFTAWKQYMVAKRALVRYHAHGINPGISKEVAEAVVAKHEGKPHFVATADAFTDFSHRALLPLVESGVMTLKEFKDVVEWNPIYVPFLRQVQLDGESAGTGGGKAINRVTKRGSNLPIHDPIDAMLMQYERIQQAAMQADVMRALVAFYDNPLTKGKYLGKFMSEQPVPLEATTFTAEQIKRSVLKELSRGIKDETVLSQAEDALESFWDERLTVFTPGTKPKGLAGKHVVSIVIDGKRRNFEVLPAMLPILQGVTQSTFLPGKGGAILRDVTGLQRLGATGLNASFGLVRNFLRDSLTSAITADYHFHVPVLTSIMGSLEDMADSEWARRYHAAGLDIAGRVGQDLNEAQFLSAQLRKGKARAFAAMPGFAAKSRFVIHGIRDILSHTEVGPRLMEFRGAYESAKKRWGNEVDATVLAGCAAKDITVNFSRAGEWSRLANEVVLFFNAAVQSGDKFMRAAGVLEAAPWASTQSRVQTAARTLARGAFYLTAAALLLYARNRDEEWWKKLPPHEKWGFLHVAMGSKILRIPLPFEAGSVFGALPVALIEDGRSPGALAEALVVALKGAMPIDGGPTTIEAMHGVLRSVALLGPIADIGFNMDWKGDPILPETTEGNRLPADQYGPRATWLAKLLGAHMPGGGMSPAQIDHLLNGYTGGLYHRLAGSLETIADPSRIQPLEDPSTLPIVGTLFLRPGTSREVGDFYDRLRHLKQKKGSRAATLAELGELTQAEVVNRGLEELWQARKRVVTSGASGGEIQREAQKILQAAQERIAAHNARAKAGDRQVGLGSVLYHATDPSADLSKLVPLPDVSLEEAQEALRSEMLRRGHNIRARNQSGTFTSYGIRQARLRRILRRRTD